MKLTTLMLGSFGAVLLLSAGPALAQRPESGGAERAVARGDAGGGASGAGGGGNVASSSTSAVSSPSVSMSPSVSAIAAPSIGMGDRSFRASAPEHRVSYSEDGQHGAAHSASSSHASPSHASSGGGQHATARSGGSSSSGSGGSSARSAPAGGGERAVPRAGVAAASAPESGRRAGESNAGSNNVNGTQEVPSWARTRGDRPATDVAVPREGPRPPRSASDRVAAGGYYSNPYYYGGFGYGYGYGYGLGLYDAGFYGYPFYSPFGFGYGIPYGYFDPYFMDPYDYGAGYGAYSSQVYGGHDQGNLKLKVKPRSAQVYVDGFYVGIVDDFDGAFQKLTLNGGRHKVELRADGYETAEFDVLITPEKTVTFAGEMKRVQ